MLKKDVSENKNNVIVYWIFNGIICGLLSVMAFMELSHDPEVVQSLNRLGYPIYILYIVGPAKLLGVLVLLVPRFPRLKEWAYAGFAILFIAGFLSHFFMGDGIDKLAPALVALTILFIGYYCRPANRKLSA